MCRWLSAVCKRRARAPRPIAKILLPFSAGGTLFRDLATCNIAGAHQELLGEKLKGPGSGRFRIVLDGELVDADGTRYLSGDFVQFMPGSKHCSRTAEGCTLLVLLRGNNRLLEAHEME